MSIWPAASATCARRTAERREASRRGGANEVPVEFVQSDGERLPFADRTFDAVWGHAILHHLELNAALSELHRVLKPGGRLALSCWCAVEQMPGYLTLEQALAKRIGPEQAALPPFSLGNADTLRSLVTSAGFREVRLRLDAKMTRFQSAEHMVRAIAGGATSMRGMLAAQGEGVLDTIVAEVSAATRAYVDDDGWAVPAVSHIVTARA